MSPNDSFWKRWDNDGGKVNLVTRLGQQQKTQSISFSNTYIQGTQTNGLSSFEPLNQTSLSTEMGELQKLQIASKVSDEGTVMLAICKSETASIYLGETQLVSSSKNAFIAQSEGVIGTINPLRGSKGTINPESVIEYSGLIYWVDVPNREVIQYSGNGLDVASKFDMIKFFQKYFKDYAATSSATIDTLNGFHHIPTAIDPSFRKELLVITPALAAESELADLPSYTGTPSYATSIKNRFDVYDKQVKAIGLSLEKNIWGHTYQFGGEWYEYISGTMYGFKDGVLYEHDYDAVNWNTFYGAAKPIRLVLSLNEIFSADRELGNISVEGSVAPTYTVAHSSNPDIQITDLTEDDFKKRGTVYYSHFLRDRTSPNKTGTADEKLYTGDPLTGNPLTVMLEWNINNKQVYVDAVNLGFLVSKGLQQIIQK
jgi:hypothetical protein